MILRGKEIVAGGGEMLLGFEEGGWSCFGGGGWFGNTVRD